MTVVGEVGDCTNDGSDHKYVKGPREGGDADTESVVVRYLQIDVSPVAWIAKFGTITLAVSVQLAKFQIKLYVPPTRNPVIVVVGLVGLFMVTDPGLPAIAVHVPVPMAAIVAVPFTHVRTSGPALGLEVTITATVSVQIIDDQT